MRRTRRSRAAPHRGQEAAPILGDAPPRSHNELVSVRVRAKAELGADELGPGVEAAMFGMPTSV